MVAIAAGAPDACTRQLSRRYVAGAVVALLCAVLAVGSSPWVANESAWRGVDI